MVSQMAMEDLAQLRADGIDVPPREVVRLNALGLKVERGANTLDVYAAPRVAFLGEKTLCEPTLGTEMWMRRAADAFDADDPQTWLALRVLSCLVPFGHLPEATDRKAVVEAMDAALKSLAPFTVRQVKAALEWVLEGNAPEDGEYPPCAASEKTPNDEPPPRFAPEYGLFLRGVAARIGTFGDIKSLTVSQTLAACERAEALAGAGEDEKQRKSNAFGDYCRALDAIRARPEQGGASQPSPEGGE